MLYSLGKKYDNKYYGQVHSVINHYDVFSYVKMLKIKVTLFLNLLSLTFQYFILVDCHINIEVSK